MGKDRFLQDILDGLKKENAKQIKTKTYWFETFAKFNEEEIKDFSDDICSLIKLKIDEIIESDSKIPNDKVSEKYFKNYNDTSKNFEKRYSVTFVNGKPGRPEDALERLLTIVNGAKFQNQKVTPDGGHIDIVTDIDEEKETATFIELKKWDNHSDNPLYALIESLKNKYLIENIDKIDCENLKSAYSKLKKVNKIIILAPEQYYKYYSNNEQCKKAIKNMYAMIEYISQELGVCIKLKSISFDEENDWNSLIEYICDNNFLEENKFSFFKNQNKIIDYLKKKEQFEKLLIENWNELKSFTDW